LEKDWELLDRPSVESAEAGLPPAYEFLDRSATHVVSFGKLSSAQVREKSLNELNSALKKITGSPCERLVNCLKTFTKPFPWEGIEKDLELKNPKKFNLSKSKDVFTQAMAEENHYFQPRGSRRAFQDHTLGFHFFAPFKQLLIVEKMAVLNTLVKVLPKFIASDELKIGDSAIRATYPLKKREEYFGGDGEPVIAKYRKPYPDSCLVQGPITADNIEQTANEMYADAQRHALEIFLTCLDDDKNQFPDEYRLNALAELCFVCPELSDLKHKDKVADKTHHSNQNHAIEYLTLVYNRVKGSHTQRDQQAVNRFCDSFETMNRQIQAQKPRGKMLKKAKSLVDLKGKGRAVS
jgi:hypothetical protein